MWEIEFSETATRLIERLDKPVQRHILRFLRQRIASQDDPRRIGKSLRAKHRGLWRYRVGDYRLICRIHDPERRILVVTLGHRRDVYR